MATYRWKFLNEEGRSIVSKHGDLKWKIGDWQHVDGEIRACSNGLHASKKMYEAFSYVQGSVLAKVEVKGKKDEEDDKAAYSDMRIVEAYKWTKKDSVELAIYAAELVIGIYEKQYPNDTRPGEAIEAAKTYIARPTKKNMEAAYAASAARAAGYATSAAARAASAAAYAASAADATSAAARAAYAASAAAYAAPAAYALLKKIDKWMQNRLDELDRI